MTDFLTLSDGAASAWDDAPESLRPILRDCADALAKAAEVQVERSNLLLEVARLLREIESLRADRDERAVQKGDLLAETERLTECLRTANAQTEHFEREWYLRGDELERLRAENDQMRPELLRLRLEKTRLRGSCG